MFYHLFQYLETLNFPGAGVFQYISFRSALSMITSLIIAIWFGKWFIKRLKQAGKTEVEETRTKMGEQDSPTMLNCETCENNVKNFKKNVPTMGGLIIVLAIVIPTLLFAQLNNVYTILMLITTLWLTGLGFLDDYLKLKKHNKDGLPGKYKIFGQIALGVIVGGVLYFSPDAVIRERVEQTNSNPEAVVEVVGNPDCSGITEYSDVKSTKTTIPFFKNNELDYKWFVSWAGDYAEILAWLVFIVMTILVVAAVSNGANLTDGLDGLATGTSAIIGATLGILAYVSGNRVAAEYLNILYIPNSGELVVYAAAFIGATIGFLWYNSYPAQVFMGDTGSLTLGGIIAVFAIIIKKELILPILCGIFLAESVSVIIQRYYFKYTRIKYGEGRRFFKMAPLHHHYQKKGIPESKIVARFWIVTLLLAAISIITLKLR